MKTLIRWGKFNLVGALGAGVQLTVLALLHHVTGTHYLFASALAIEVTLLHNFVWHWHSTWRDRRAETSPGTALLRFQLSNGAVSLAGNLVLMRALVGAGHLPVIVANGVAILCCSVLNFRLGDRWAFAREAMRARTPAEEVC